MEEFVFAEIFPEVEAVVLSVTPAPVNLQYWFMVF